MANPIASVDAPAADTQAEPVVVNEGGETQEEKKFSQADLDKYLNERLARQKKQFEKEIAQVKKPAVSPALEEDVKAKLTQYEADLKARDEKLNTYRQKNLRATVEGELAKHGCVDPELVANEFLTKQLVKLDDDDSIFVENTRNSLEDLAKDYLAKKPHLVANQAKAGVGTKGPQAPAGSQPSLEELLGIKHKTESFLTKKKGN